MSLSHSFVNDVRTRISSLKRLTNSRGIQFPQELESTLSTFPANPCEEVDVAIPAPRDSDFECESSFFSLNQEEPFNRESYRLQLDEMRLKTSKMGEMVNSKIKNFKKADLMERNRHERILQELQQIRINIGSYKHRNTQIRRRNKTITRSLVKKINDLQSHVDHISKRISKSIPRHIEREDDTLNTKRDLRRRNSRDFEKRTSIDCQNCNVF